MQTPRDIRDLIMKRMLRCAGAGWAVSAGAGRRGVYGAPAVATAGQPERLGTDARWPIFAVANRPPLRAA